jgi:hypothetical protein
MCLLIPLLLPRRRFAVAAVCVLAASGALLMRENLRWRFAADSSAHLSAYIEDLARKIPPGSGLILDIPHSIGRQYLWLSSLPFALEPPYSSGNAYRLDRVIERPLLYQYWSGSVDKTGRTWIGDRLSVLQNLVAHPADTYHISMDPSGRIKSRRVEPAALARLAQLMGRHAPYDLVFDFDLEWDTFWRDNE